MLNNSDIIFKSGGFTVTESGDEELIRPSRLRSETYDRGV